jgi:hypothetical protein
MRLWLVMMRRDAVHVEDVIAHHGAVLAGAHFVAAARTGDNGRESGGRCEWGGGIHGPMVGRDTARLKGPTS